MSDQAIWTVRVYEPRSGNMIATWSIGDRTEHEAAREAEADVVREFGNDVDWTMMKEPV